ncbi:MAG: hypothetical protein IKR62_03665, partial [Victivallales bacterium]|nr:hypothetical protein [Victivallales bacterium]
ADDDEISRQATFRDDFGIKVCFHRFLMIRVTLRVNCGALTGAVSEGAFFPQAACPYGHAACGYDCFALRAVPLSRRFLKIISRGSRRCL